MMMKNKIMKNKMWWKAMAMSKSSDKRWRRDTIKPKRREKILCMYNYEKCHGAFRPVLVKNNGSGGNKYSLE